MVDVIPQMCSLTCSLFVFLHNRGRRRTPGFCVGERETGGRNWWQVMNKRTAITFLKRWISSCRFRLRGGGGGGREMEGSGGWEEE